jgi:hypothetical protein
MGPLTSPPGVETETVPVANRLSSFASYGRQVFFYDFVCGLRGRLARQQRRTGRDQQQSTGHPHLSSSHLTHLLYLRCRRTGCSTTVYLPSGGANRFLVACSKAYPISIKRGSLQASAVKLTPNGEGRGSKPPGNAGVGAFGTVPNATITVG